MVGCFSLQQDQGLTVSASIEDGDQHMSYPLGNFAYAFETLEIEKHRLLKAIRDMRSLPVIGDDFPVGRIEEHNGMISELDKAISALKAAIEESHRKFKLEMEESEKLSAAYLASQRKPKIDTPSE
jgi:hypothetical protein